MSYVQGNPRLLYNLCLEISTFLQGKYPHVAWAVRPTPDGSMIQIVIVGVGADPNIRYTIATNKIQQATGRNKELIKIGGEVLERYNMHRSKRDFEGEVPALSKRGFMMPDMS